MNDEYSRGYTQGKQDAMREMEIEMVHPSTYDDGFEDGYKVALASILDDECFEPMVVEAREWLSKKERNAHR